MIVRKISYREAACVWLVIHHLERLEIALESKTRTIINFAVIWMVVLPFASCMTCRPSLAEASPWTSVSRPRVETVVY